ncbi:TRAP transporter small permease subunit [Acidimangrovimonas sediminis]|uniref:TRAP transporter small permease subunit n=1 Tax=Acidimangrovimonas sediminis TaxID=2056283 RepID=UPI000C803C94|nr:TRAP transporter small permease subunit [Acidimangrovimonas sediminis]
MKALLSRLVAAMDRISVFIGQASGVFYFTCIALSAIEVFRRYVLNDPSDWSMEVVMTLCASAWALAVGYVTQRDRHIAITMLELLVGPRVWRWFRLLQLVIAIVTIATLCWAVWDPAMRQFASPERSGTAMNSIQPAYFHVLILVSGFLYLGQLIANLIRWFDEPAMEPRHGH